MRPEVAAFGRDLVQTLRQGLGDQLVGACFIGSTALGGYVPGESDLDVSAVCRSALAPALRESLAERLLEAARRCPARGLELTLYRAAAVATCEAVTRFEVNVNGGPRMPEAVHHDPAEEPGFFYVIDRAIAHRHRVPIAGPPPGEVFADVPRAVLLRQLAASLQWHRAHEKATLYSVLNACRAWRFAVADVLGSKLAGARWARSRWLDPSVIDAAVELRHGRAGHLDQEDVDRLVAFVAHEVAAAT